MLIQTASISEHMIPCLSRHKTYTNKLSECYPDNKVIQKYAQRNSRHQTNMDKMLHVSYKHFITDLLARSLVWHGKACSTQRQVCVCIRHNDTNCKTFSDQIYAFWTDVCYFHVWPPDTFCFNKSYWNYPSGKFLNFNMKWRPQKIQKNFLSNLDKW